jgi:hypothetical protein
MKYGWNDRNNVLDTLGNATALCTRARLFAIDTFQPTMKRKTCKPEDKIALAALKEMVEMMENHFNEIENK